MTDPTTSSPAVAKLDPESLALRGRPVAAIRFRRGLMIGGAAAGSIGLMALAWAALLPTQRWAPMAPDELSQPARPAGDAVAAWPKTYEAVPQLGPPLPGDLGPPILRRQRQDAAAMDIEPAVVPSAVRPAPSEWLEERKAARASALLVTRVGERRTEPMSDRTAVGADQFTNVADQVDPHRIAPPASPYLLSAGSIIAASLITGIRSDLPGLVTAQVTEPVFDSPTGRILLIPQGARLIGSYGAEIAYGQSRAAISWQRIIYPDGSSLTLDDVPASDPAGYAGLEDRVDRHTGLLIKGVILSTLLGVGSELAYSGEGDIASAIRRSGQDATSRAGDQIVGKGLDVRPTVTIRPGAPVRLISRKDLVLAPWTGRKG